MLTSTPRQNYPWIRWLFIASLALLAFYTALTVVRYPALVAADAGQAIFYLGLLVVALSLYAGFAWAQTGSASAQVSLQHGLGWGFLCGGAWILELLVGNLIGPQLGQSNLVFYFGSAFVGYLLPGLAAFLAAKQANKIQAGIAAGLWCGMLGSLSIFLVSILLSGLLTTAGQTDPQTLREFQRSGQADLMAYIAGDYLAGMIAHLWIGLTTGLIFGALGGVLGKGVAGWSDPRQPSEI